MPRRPTNIAILYRRIFLGKVLVTEVPRLATTVLGDGIAMGTVVVAKTGPLFFLIDLPQKALWDRLVQVPAIQVITKMRQGA